VNENEPSAAGYTAWSGIALAPTTVRSTQAPAKLPCLELPETAPVRVSELPTVEVVVGWFRVTPVMAYW
jgi:hypothetical protein